MPRYFSFIRYNPIVCFAYRLFYRIQCRKLKSIIFVATTGRSGTMTLVDILNHVAGCKAEHEPYPAMYDEVLKAKSAGDEDFVSRTYWQVKSINLWRSAVGTMHYFESNHMFIKTYIEYAVEDFTDKVVVIHLARDPVKVANSIYALQHIPGTEEGNKWWLDYTAKNNIIQIADILDNDPEFQHPFYKGLWYWYEIDERVKYWKQRLPNVRFIDFKTEDFNDQTKTFALLETLNIDFDPQQLAHEINTQSNTRPHQKVSEPLSLEMATKMNEKFQSLLSSLNFAVA